MSWWEYVQEVAGQATQTAISEHTGIAQSTINRWRTATPRAESVAIFARAYRRPVLEAFVAAGFLTPEEAKLTEVPADLSQIESGVLLAELRRRIPDG